MPHVVAIYPTDNIGTTKTTEMHLTLTSCFQLQVCLPFLIDKLVKSIIRCFRFHITGEETCVRWFSLQTAVVHYVPPRNAVYTFLTEPDAIKITGEDGLNHFTTSIGRWRRNCYLAYVYGQSYHRQAVEHLPDLFWRIRHLMGGMTSSRHATDARHLQGRKYATASQ